MDLYKKEENPKKDLGLFFGPCINYRKNKVFRKDSNNSNDGNLTRGRLKTSKHRLLLLEGTIRLHILGLEKPSINFNPFIHHSNMSAVSFKMSDKIL